MNIIVAIIFGLKCAPECIKMHHFEGELPKEFGGGAPQTPLALGRGHLTPVGTFGASVRVHSTPLPPDHISGYRPALCNVQ